MSRLGSAPRTLHPYPESQQYTTPWSDAATLIWNGGASDGSSLLHIDYGNTLDWVADPAKSMAVDLPRVSNGGRTYTFTLRSDLKWSDNQPITAADFQFAFDNACKKDNNWVGYTGTCERIESFKTPDPRTVEVTLKEVLAKFLGTSIAAGIYPVPRQVWEGKSWNDPAQNPEILKPTVVSGPYMPKEFNAERQTFVRNPNWWGQPPLLDEVVFVAASPQTIFELLKTRQVEWAQNVAPSQWEEAKNTPTVNAVQWAGATGNYRLVQFNLARPNVKDLKFRQAIAYALNRQDAVQFEDGLAEPQFGFFPNGSRWRFDGAARYDYDLARSRQLLQEAGYTVQGGTLRGSDGQPVKIEVLWPTTSAPRGKIATYLQQQLKQLGIDLQVTGLEFSAFLDRYQLRRDFDLVMGGFSAELDPDSIRSQLVTDGSQNATGYSNKRVDDLFDQGAREQDDTKRKAIYDEIQKIVMDDLPQFYITTLQNTTAFDKKVAGVVPLKGGDILRQNNLQILQWYITQ